MIAANVKKGRKPTSGSAACHERRVEAKRRMAPDVEASDEQKTNTVVVQRS